MPTTLPRSRSPHNVLHSPSSTWCARAGTVYERTYVRWSLIYRFFYAQALPPNASIRIQCMPALAGDWHPRPYPQLTILCTSPSCWSTSCITGSPLPSRVRDRLVFHPEEVQNREAALHSLPCPLHACALFSGDHERQMDKRLHASGADSREKYECVQHSRACQDKENDGTLCTIVCCSNMHCFCTE